MGISREEVGEMWEVKCRRGELRSSEEGQQLHKEEMSKV